MNKVFVILLMLSTSCINTSRTKVKCFEADLIKIYDREYHEDYTSIDLKSSNSQKNADTTSRFECLARHELKYENQYFKIWGSSNEFVVSLNEPSDSLRIFSLPNTTEFLGYSVYKDKVSVFFEGDNHLVEVKRLMFTDSTTMLYSYEFFFRRDKLE